MSNAGPDRVAEFVDDILHGRRPRRFKATAEEAEAMSAAAILAAGRIGSDLPSSAALERIHRRLSAALDEAPRAEQRLTRRMWLRTAGAIAAAVVAGVALDELATTQRDGGAGGPGGTLLPDNGSWQAVASVTQVPPGHAVQVSTPAVQAILVNDAGNISAVSGVCTHLGCVLRPDNTNRKLDCPCHQTSFGWSGKVLYYRLKSAPADLPRIPSRVNGDQVELFIA